MGHRIARDQLEQPLEMRLSFGAPPQRHLVYGHILQRGLEARVDFQGLAKLRDGVTVQDSLNYGEPPDWYFPVRESLGAALLMNNDAAGAEKAKNDYFAATFSDAIAIYMLSLLIDVDYYELREREYPLLAPTALAERLRKIHELFPPNPGFEFNIFYRRRQ